MTLLLFAMQPLDPKTCHRVEALSLLVGLTPPSHATLATNVASWHLASDPFRYKLGCQVRHRDWEVMEIWLRLIPAPLIDLSAGQQHY